MTRKFNQYKLQVIEEKGAKAGATASGSCGCSCYYANSGGSSTIDNGCANADNGYHSEHGYNHIFFKTVTVTA